MPVPHTLSGVVECLLKPGENLAIELAGIADAHAMGDHAVPRARWFEATGWLAAFELDADIQARGDDLHDRELLGPAQDANVGVGRRLRHAWAECADLGQELVVGCAPPGFVPTEEPIDALVSRLLGLGSRLEGFNERHRVPAPQAEVVGQPGDNLPVLDAFL